MTSGNFESVALRFIGWIGTPASVIAHTLIFVLFLLLIFLGFDTEKVLLILTTGVSLEAIYLSIFIQMTINHHTKVLKSVSNSVEDIQDNVEDIQDVIEEEFEEEVEE